MLKYPSYPGDFGNHSSKFRGVELLLQWISLVSVDTQIACCQLPSGELSGKSLWFKDPLVLAISVSEKRMLELIGT